MMITDLLVANRKIKGHRKAILRENLLEGYDSLPSLQLLPAPIKYDKMLCDSPSAAKFSNRA